MFVTNVFHIKQNRQQIDSQKNPPFFQAIIFFLSYIFHLLLSVNVDEDIDLICTFKPVLKGHIWDTEKVSLYDR